MRIAWRGKALGRTLGIVAVVALLAGFLVACGSDDGDATEESSSSSAAAGSAVIDEATKISGQATRELMFATSETPSKPSEIVPYGDWRGADSAPPHEAGRTVEVILCAKTAPTCVIAGEAVAEAAETLGWKTDIIDGEGTPQGFSRAYTTALSRKPDAIVGIAVPSAVVGKNLAEAKQRGVVTVQAGAPEPSSGPSADAYVPFPMSAMSSLIGWSMIAETNGEADAIVVTDPVYPEIVESSEAIANVLGECEGCNVSMVEQPFTDAIDPTKVNANIRGALAQSPDANYLYNPYSAPLAAEVQAVQSAGKGDQVKIVSKNADEVELAAVAEGTVAYAVGSSARWAGWAGVDQVIRGLGGAPYLKGPETGLAIAKFDKSNMPPSGNIDDWDQMIDFRAEYERIWK